MNLKTIALLVLLISGVTFPIKAADLIVNGSFASTVTAWAGVNSKGTPIATPVTWEPGFEGWDVSASPDAYIPLTVSSAVHHTNMPPDVTITPISIPCAFIGNQQLLTPTPVANGGVRSTMSQTIMMPDAFGATLTFYYQWRVFQSWAGQDEYARISLNSTTLVSKAGGELDDDDWQSFIYYFPINHQTGVVEAKGQAVTLKFETTDDEIADDNFLLVDDVSLIVNSIATATQTCTHSPTSTHSPTITKTPTLTITRTITPTCTITPSITQTVTLTPWHVQEGKVIAYPNPANGNEVRFVYSAFQAMNAVQIDIYNLAGLKVATLKDGPKSEEINHETTWAINEVAPGIYLYRLTLEADGGYKSETKFKKLVITK